MTFERPEQRFAHWEEIRKAVSEAFIAEAKTNPALKQPGDERDDEYLRLVARIVDQNPQWGVQPVELAELVELLAQYQFGYRGLEPYLQLPGLEDVMINRYDELFYVQGGVKHRISEQLFADEDDLIDFIKQIATENGIEINLQRPVIDARLRDGSRVNAILPPIAVDGPSCVIRKHREMPFTLEDYFKQGMLTREAAYDIGRFMLAGWNGIVSGGTSSGKTSLLNALGRAFLPKDDRVVILEDSTELRIKTDDTKYLQARRDATRDTDKDDNAVTIDDLIRFSLRMRPDRIIVGELRGSEARAALKAWNSGHDGSLSTLHADSGMKAIAKLMQLIRSREEPEESVLQQIGDAIDFIIQVQRFKGQGARKITEIIQVVNEYKIDVDDAKVAERVEQLKATGELKTRFAGAWVLPLYVLDRSASTLVKRNDPLPIVGKPLRERKQPAKPAQPQADPAKRQLQPIRDDDHLLPAGGR